MSVKVLLFPLGRIIIKEILLQRVDTISFRKVMIQMNATVMNTRERKVVNQYPLEVI